jgi:hypothetical protein
MPVKRRVGKRRFSEVSELEAWNAVFATGCHMLGLLKGIGVQTDEHLAPEIGAAHSAWRRLGTAFLATYDDAKKMPWALRMFGDPACQ